MFFLPYMEQNFHKINYQNHSIFWVVFSFYHNGFFFKAIFYYLCRYTFLETL